MLTIEPIRADEIDLGEVEFYNLNQDGEGLAAIAGEGFANVNTTRDVLDGPATVGCVTTTGLPATVTFLEHHNHTAEVVLSPESDIILLIAPASAPGVGPRAADVQAIVVPKGSAVVLPRNVWHSLGFGVDGGTHYFWLSHQIPNPQPDALVDLDEPIQITRPTGDLQSAVAGLC